MARPIHQKACIQTGRLTLKPIAAQDIRDLIVLLTHPGITKTFMVPEFKSDAEAENLAKLMISFSDIQNTEHLEYGIYLNDHLIGFINDCGIQEDSLEIGYVIHPDAQGHGYATEAVRAILPELRGMGFKKATAGYFVGNEASRKVMEKCGMTPIAFTDEGMYRGEKRMCRYCEICF